MRRASGKTWCVYKWVVELLSIFRSVSCLSYKVDGKETAGNEGTERDMGNESYLWVSDSNTIFWHSSKPMIKTMMSRFLKFESQLDSDLQICLLYIHSYMFRYQRTIYMRTPADKIQHHGQHFTTRFLTNVIEYPHHRYRKLSLVSCQSVPTHFLDWVFSIEIL